MGQTRLDGSLSAETITEYLISKLRHELQFQTTGPLHRIMFTFIVSIEKRVLEEVSEYLQIQVVAWIIFNKVVI